MADRLAAALFLFDPVAAVKAHAGTFCGGTLKCTGDLRNSSPAAAAFPAAALIGLPLGIRLLRGKRRVVLCSYAGSASPTRQRR